jgi:coenzyme F420-reducing hydrogenase delta subunit
MFNLSSAMGGQFAAAAEEMTGQIKRIGPNPLRDTNQLK